MNFTGDSVIRRAAWYDQFGKKLGSGSVDVVDFPRFAAGLKGNNALVVILENETRGGNLTNPYYIGGQCSYIVSRSEFFAVSNHLNPTEARYRLPIYGITLRVISRAEAKRIVVNAVAADKQSVSAG